MTATAERIDAREFAEPANVARSATVAVARRTSAYVPEVDALRAIAMTSVIVFHCKLMPFGWMGVWIFYVVSGFSVTTSLFSRPSSTSSTGARIRNFYIRRALRIWPLYFTFVLLNVVFLVAIGKTGPLQDLPWLLTFTHNIKMILTNYTPATSWPAFGHLWTLAVEQQFYLVFPLLLLLPGRAARGVALLGVIAIAPLIRAAVGHWASGLGWDSERVAFAVYAFGPAHFDAFAVGSLIALFREEISRDRRFVFVSLALTLAVVIAHVGTYATLGVMEAGRFSADSMRNIVSGIMYGQGREITAYFLPVCACGTMLIGILSGERLCLLLCKSDRLQAIGRVSYGGYLFHIPVLMLLGTFVPIFAVPVRGPLWLASHVGLFVCAYTLTVAIAWVSFTGFEQRFTRIRWR